MAGETGRVEAAGVAVGVWPVTSPWHGAWLAVGDVSEDIKSHVGSRGVS